MNKKRTKKLLFRTVPLISVLFLTGCESMQPLASAAFKFLPYIFGKSADADAKQEESANE